MNKSLLPYLKPLIAHELQRMRPIIQAHKRLLQVSTDANIDIGGYIDIATRIISDALEKENINISDEILKVEISQEFSILCIKDTASLNPFTPNFKNNGLTTMTSIGAMNITAANLTGAVSMVVDGKQLSDAVEVPGFILKTQPDVS